MLATPTYEDTRWLPKYFLPDARSTIFIDFCLAYPYIINSTISQKML